MSKKTVISSLICPECGSIFPIIRKMGQERELFHKKWVFCYKCKKDTNHIEARDLDRLIYVLEHTPNEERTNEEQKVYSLLKRKGE